MTPPLSGLFIVVPHGETINIYIGDDRSRPHVCRHGKPVPLQGVHVETRVADMAAVTQLTQTYYNIENQEIEAKYCFTLLESSAVTGFRAEINGRVVEAKAKEKVQAKREYSDALSRGDGAYLLEQSGPDIFQCSVGNIPPKTMVKVTITFVHELKIDEKSARLLFPMHIAPRYCPVDTAEEAFFPSPEALTYSPPSGFGFSNDARLTFSASLEMPSTITRLLCTSHGDAMTGILSDSRKGHVRLGLGMGSGRSVGLDRDVVVKVECQEFHQPRCLVEQAEGEAGKGSEGTPSPYGSVAMVTMVPQFDLTELPCELVFLIDRSGSMGGRRIEQTKAALEIFVQSLPLNSVFNFVSFGTRHEAWKRDSVAYNEQTLAEARSFISSIGANFGGTELGGALRFALDRKSRDGFARQVFVLTDGQVTNTNDMLDLALRYKNKARVFTLGIGSGVSTELVAGLARAGRGDSRFVQDGEDVRQQVVGLLKRSLQPSLSDLSVEWALEDNPVEPMQVQEGGEESTAVGGDTVMEDPKPAGGDEPKHGLLSGVMSFFNPSQKNTQNEANRRKEGAAAAVSLQPAESVHQAPYQCPPIHPGSHFSVFGFVPKGKTLKSVTLKATAPEGPIKLSLTPQPVSFATSSDDQGAFAGALHKLGARAMLRDLEEGTSFLHPSAGGSQYVDLPSRVKEEGVMLGTHFGLASKWTSLIAVERRGGEGGMETELPVFIGKEHKPPQRVVPQAGAVKRGMALQSLASPGAPMMRTRKGRPSGRVYRPSVDMDRTWGMAMRLSASSFMRRGDAAEMDLDECSAGAAPASASSCAVPDLEGRGRGKRKNAKREEEKRRDDPMNDCMGVDVEGEEEEEDSDDEVWGDAGVAAEAATSNLALCSAMSAQRESLGLQNFAAQRAIPSNHIRSLMKKDKAGEKEGGRERATMSRRTERGGDGVNAIAALQSFDGHFDISDQLLRLLCVSKETLETVQRNLGVSGAEVATVVAVLVLENKFKAQKAVWELFVGKAVSWLALQRRGVEAARALLAKGRAEGGLGNVLSA